jgi:hypothetical protein
VTLAPVAFTAAPVDLSTEAPLASPPAPSPIDTLEPTEIDMSMSMDFSMDTVEFGRKGKKGKRGKKAANRSNGKKEPKNVQVEKAPKARKGGDADTVKVVKQPKVAKSLPSGKKR